MKNKVYAAALSVALALPAVTARAQQPINVTVDGDVVAFGAQRPIEQFGSVLVPLRGVFEKLGATVAYDAATRSILAVRGTTNVTLKLGSRDATVNDAARTLSVPAQALNGTTLVPLRFVSEALGAQVRWQAASRTVIVSSAGGEVDAGSVAGDTGNNAPQPPPAPRRGLPTDAFRYGRITVRWNFNNLSVSDRTDLEGQIRRQLNLDAGSPLLTRRPASGGNLDVYVTLRRADPGTVLAEVRLSLNPAGITGTDTATAASRDNSVDGRVVLQALRKARRQFGNAVDERARGGR